MTFLNAVAMQPSLVKLVATQAPVQASQGWWTTQGRLSTDSLVNSLRPAMVRWSAAKTNAP
jgi:hypothetical protein